MDKQRASMRDWKIVREFGYIALVGTIVEHPKLAPETFAKTSEVIRLEKVNHKITIAETQNTIYQLHD